MDKNLCTKKKKIGECANLQYIAKIFPCRCNAYDYGVCSLKEIYRKTNIMLKTEWNDVCLRDKFRKIRDKYF